jgi:hypothetical protein
MSKKFIFVDANGQYEESPGAFEVSEHIDATTGAPDAGKPIITDAGGLIDGSFIDDSDIDHGSISGLGDDDHTQYILVDGTRAFSGDQSMGTNQLTSVGDPTASAIDGASDDAIPMSFLASTANGEGSSTLGVEDVGAYFVNDNVEDVLQELGALVGGPSYTTDGVGVTKGDLVHISANDTVTVSLLTTALWSPGLAENTAGAASPVTVSKNDTILTGVLTGATAGTVYYWDGSAHTATQPATASSYVWKTGMAKNATDLHVEVQFIKKNQTP